MVPITAPSILRLTDLTPILSAALTAIVTVPETEAPLAGEVMLTEGGVMSAVTVFLEIVIVLEAALPAASLAVAIIVCALPSAVHAAKSNDAQLQ